MGLQIEALSQLPRVREGDDLAALIIDALGRSQLKLQDGDLIAVAHKVVSKSEGQVRNLTTVEPTTRAAELGAKSGKDPRLIQVILDESRSLLRDEPVIVAETKHGLICANAGVDTSNAPDEEIAVLLPADPDASARKIRQSLHAASGLRPAVVITDSFGRPWRLGQCDVAIGCAGLEPLDDWRGRSDAGGKELRATLIAVADQVAAAADLVRNKNSLEPVVLVRGFDRYVTAEDGPGAKALVRPADENLFS